MQDLIDIGQYVQDRNEAILSFDHDKIMAFAKKYRDAFGLPIPEDKDVLYAAAMKTIVTLPGTKASDKQKARDWLRKKGYMEGICWMEK